MSLGKTLNSNIPTSNGEAQWIRTQNKNASCRLSVCILNWEMYRCVLEKNTLRLYSHNGAKQLTRLGSSVWLKIA